MKRFEKKDLKTSLFPNGYPITWKNVRDAFQRIAFGSATRDEFCTMLFHPLLQESRPKLPKDYRFWLDLVSAMSRKEPVILRLYGDIEAQLNKEYPRIHQLLVSEDFIEDIDAQRFGLKERGHSLRMQKMLKPISRKKANGMVADIARRAEEINQDPDATQRVKAIYVYGSYLTDKPLLGDLDIAVSVVLNRPKDESYKEWKLRDRAWAEKAHCKEGEKAVHRKLAVNNSVSISNMVNLRSLIEEGRAESRCIFGEDDTA